MRIRIYVYVDTCMHTSSKAGRARDIDACPWRMQAFKPNCKFCGSGLRQCSVMILMITYENACTGATGSTCTVAMATRARENASAPL